MRFLFLIISICWLARCAISAAFSIAGIGNTPKISCRSRDGSAEDFILIDGPRWIFARQRATPANRRDNVADSERAKGPLIARTYAPGEIDPICGVQNVAALSVLFPIVRTRSIVLRRRRNRVGFCRVCG